MCMGVLRRATFAEIAVIAEDPLWWEDVRGRISDGGTLKDLCEENGWSYGALWTWVNADVGRRKEYDVALEGKAERAHDECIPIADGGGGDTKRDALRVSERRKSAEISPAQRCISAAAAPAVPAKANAQGATAFAIAKAAAAATPPINTVCKPALSGATPVSVP